MRFKVATVPGRRKYVSHEFAPSARPGEAGKASQI